MKNVNYSVLNYSINDARYRYYVCGNAKQIIICVKCIFVRLSVFSYTFIYTKNLLLSVNNEESLCCNVHKFQSQMPNGAYDFAFYVALCQCIISFA